MARGQKKGGQSNFVGLPRKLLFHENTRSLSNAAFRLLVMVYEQYRGPGYNGQLCASWKLMKDRGFTSKSTTEKALKELLEKGFLIQTRQGGRHQASLYAVTWEALDDCPKKALDRPPQGNERTKALNYWQRGYNPEIGTRAPYSGQSTPYSGQYEGGKDAS
jgi:hypothetical protein